VGTISLGLVDLAAADLTLVAAFFLGFKAAGLGSAAALDSGFLGRLTGGGHCWRLRRHRDRLRIGIWGRSGFGVDDTHARTT
jgi:hypothetical protein